MGVWFKNRRKKIIPEDMEKRRFFMLQETMRGEKRDRPGIRGKEKGLTDLLHASCKRSVIAYCGAKSDRGAKGSRRRGVRKNDQISKKRTEGLR